MNLIVDENLPPKMAKSLEQLFMVDHNIEHMRDKFKKGTSDLKWMKALSAEKEKKWIVLTSDRKLSTNKHERAAFRSSNLIAVIFVKTLQQASTIKKMVRLLSIWDQIEQLAKASHRGTMFEIRARSSQLKKL